MTIQCFLLDWDHAPEERVPGAMWFNRSMAEGPSSVYYRQHYLSNEYMRDWLGKRWPLWVVLPNNDWFCVDSRAAKTRETGEGWTVSGEAPNITVKPSIHVLEDDGNGSERTRWHGFLTDGVLT